MNCVFIWVNTWSSDIHSPQIKETWSKSVHSVLLQTERYVPMVAPHICPDDGCPIMHLTPRHWHCWADSWPLVTRLGAGSLYSAYLGHGGWPGGSLVTPAHLTRASAWPPSLCQHNLGRTEAEFNIPVWPPITTSGASRGSDNNVFIWLLGAVGATNCSISSGLWDQMWRY